MNFPAIDPIAFTIGPLAIRWYSLSYIIGILFGHIIVGFALTQLLDWTWLKNLMSEEDKTRMLKSYTWKDLLVDGAIVTVVLGIIFLIISIFL